MKGIGISGTIAKAFIKSKLTPLIIIASLLLGLLAVMITPREEEPQILVPMIDIFVAYPGASPREVEARVTKPMEKLLWEIKGVEYIYSIVKPGFNLTIVRFYVGQSMEESIVNLNNKLSANYDRIPPGVSPPLIKQRSIDDVPILTLTLWSDSDRYSGYELRRIGAELCDEIKKDQDVSEFSLIGGQKRQVRITLDPARLKAYHLSAFQIAGALQKANFLLPSGSFPAGNREYLVETGAFLKSSEEVGNVVTGLFNGRPVYLRDVAAIADGPEEPASYVFMGLGAAAAQKGIRSAAAGQKEAVTITIAKKKGANASLVAQGGPGQGGGPEGKAHPRGCERHRDPELRRHGQGEIRRTPGAHADGHHRRHHPDRALPRMAGGHRGRRRRPRDAGPDAPDQLPLRLHAQPGHPLCADLLHRHPGRRRHRGGGKHPPPLQAPQDRTADRGPGRGRGGQSHHPGHPRRDRRAAPDGLRLRPDGTLYAPHPGRRLGGHDLFAARRLHRQPLAELHRPEEREEGGRAAEEGGRMFRIYERILGPLLESRFKRMLALGSVVLLLLLAVTLVPLKKVTVKMLPFDNKSELQVIIDMPEGRTLEETAALAREMGEYLKTVPEVTDYQTYVGTAAPYNFNGLVRHYFLRSGSTVADIQVNFVAKGERKEQSHAIAIECLSLCETSLPVS